MRPKTGARQRVPEGPSSLAGAVDFGTLPGEGYARPCAGFSHSGWLPGLGSRLSLLTMFFALGSVRDIFPTQVEARKHICRID
jgi:hypothetical protein